MSKRKHEELLIDDLTAADQDEDMHDVALIGSDGASVLAVRAILAVRSDYWKKKWFRRNTAVSGPPSYYEASHFTSTTLRAVKRYCYTGSCEDFRAVSSSVDRVREMTRLIIAAKFHCLPALEKATISKLHPLIEKRPPLACEMLEESTLWGEPSSFASTLIIMRTEAALLPGNDADGKGVIALTESSLESILGNVQLADNGAFFRAIVKWYKVDEEGRLDAAKNIISRIRLDLIRPSDMYGFVKGSGLVSKDQCLDALGKWSFRAEKVMSGALITRQHTLSLSFKDSHDLLVVEDAGVVEANGLYTPFGTNDGVPRYAKYDTWMGSEVKFEVYRPKRSPAGKQKWIMKVVILDSNEAEKGDIVLYASSSSNEKKEIIPKDNWLLARTMGEERFVPQKPVPTVYHLHGAKGDGNDRIRGR